MEIQLNRGCGTMKPEGKIPLHVFATDKKCPVCGSKFKVKKSSGRPYLECKGCGFMTTKNIVEGIK